MKMSFWNSWKIFGSKYGSNLFSSVFFFFLYTSNENDLWYSGEIFRSKYGRHLFFFSFYAGELNMTIYAIKMSDKLINFIFANN